MILLDGEVALIDVDDVRSAFLSSRTGRSGCVGIRSPSRKLSPRTFESGRPSATSLICEVELVARTKSIAGDDASDSCA